MSRPRWSIFISRKPDGETRYLFQDHSKTEPEKVGVCYGTSLHFYNAGFTSMNDPADAIVFCDYLNKTEQWNTQ
jgi:hypothetical protein